MWDTVAVLLVRQHAAVSYYEAKNNFYVLFALSCILGSGLLKSYVAHADFLLGLVCASAGGILWGGRLVRLCLRLLTD